MIRVPVIGRREAIATLAITLAVTTFALAGAAWAATEGHWPFALVLGAIAVPWRRPKELAETIRVALNRPT